ncbi:MAG: putative transport system permease protein [Rhodocyclales bacterium]|nr:putative transport system permease protein [Rhodocyclales bacterium]
MPKLPDSLLIVLSILRTELELALRNLIREPGRAGSALAATIFGVAALVLARGFVGGMIDEYRESTIRGEYGHVQVTRPDFHTRGSADPFSFLLPDEQSSPNVEPLLANGLEISPQLQLAGLMSFGETTLSFIGEGVTIKALAAQLGHGMKLVKGRLPKSDDEKAIMIGVGLARMLSIEPGAKVVMLANSPKGGMNAVEVEVVGTFTAVSRAYDEVAARLPLPLARQLLRVQGSHQWIFQLENTDRTDAAVSKLRKLLDKDKFEVTPWYELAEFFNRASELLRSQLIVIEAVVVGIILLGISNTLTMAVLERTREIGTCLALGDPQRLVMRRFLIEGVVVGVAGGMAGLFLAMLVAWPINSLAIAMPPPPGMAQGYVVHITITFVDSLSALLLVAFSAMAASVLPAWRASRIVIVDALRTGR